MAVLTVAFVRTSAEQERALGAERAALAAQATSDAHLQTALITQARAALLAGAMPEVRGLAAHALVLGEDPAARGLLAAARAAPLPIPPDRLPLPPCRDVALSPTGAAVACVEADALSLWRDARVWRVPLVVDRAVLTDERLVAIVEDRLLDVALADGAVRSEREVPADWGVGLTTGGARVWATIAGEDAWEAPVEPGPPTRSRPCGDAGAAARSDGPSGPVLACDDGALWVAGRRLSTDLAVGKGQARILATSPDGARAAAGTPEGEVLVIALADGETARRWSTAAGAVRALAWSPSGRWLAVATEREGVRVLDPAAGTERVRLPRGRARALAFDGEDLLVVVSDEVERWSLPVGAPWWQAGADHGVAALAVSPGAVATAHGDGAIRVHPLPGGPERTLRWQPLVAKDTAFVGERVVGVGMGAVAPHLLGESARPLQGAASVPSRRVVTVGEDVVAVPFNGSGPYRWRGPDLDDAPLDLALGDCWDAESSPDGSRAALACASGVVVLGEGVVDATPAPRAVALGDDGRLAILREDGLWHGSFDGLRGSFDGLRAGPPLDDTLVDVAVSPEGRWIAAAGLSGRAWLVDARENSLAAILPGHGARLSSVAFTADGAALLTGGWDGAVRRHALDAIDQNPVEDVALVGALGLGRARLLDDASR